MSMVESSCVAFRVDASFQIGSGHVMRCLTLADELKHLGVNVIFICREHPGHLTSLIENKGYKLELLTNTGVEYIPTANDVAHAAWLGVPWHQDADETITAINRITPNWLIVDHYAIDNRWEKMLRPYVNKIMVIDDLADRPHDCDLLLDQNLYQSMEQRYMCLIPDYCKTLLGPKYALLRTEFVTARNKLVQRNGQVRKILVFFGGVDLTNETMKALNALSRVNNRHLDVNVVVGAGNLNKEQIQNFCALNDNFYYHCQVDNMARLMVDTDLAIGAGGTTTWERCAMGIPSIVLAVADNQKELAETGARNGLFFYIGMSSTVSSDHLLNAIHFTMSFPETMQLYSANCIALVDAKGVNRLVNQLIPPRIIIRQASVDDCDSIYEWRNDEETRRYIFNSEPLSLETHREWYFKTLANPNRILLIGDIDNKPVGVLRYDFSEHEALISVYLVPGGQGQGVGSHLIRSGSQWVKRNYPQIRIVNAEIFKENIASLRAFEAAGYKEHHAIFKEAL